MALGIYVSPGGHWRWFHFVQLENKLCMEIFFGSYCSSKKVLEMVVCWLWWGKTLELFNQRTQFPLSLHQNGHNLLCVSVTGSETDYYTSK